jgi:hypothetical protein
VVRIARDKHFSLLLQSVNNCNKNFIFVKIRAFVPDKPFQPSLKFAGKARAPPPVDQLKGTAGNIRLGWKGLPRSNALVYYK